MYSQKLIKSVLNQKNKDEDNLKKNKKSFISTMKSLVNKE
jgi:hypothetical protein